MPMVSTFSDQNLSLNALKKKKITVLRKRENQLKLTNTQMVPSIFGGLEIYKMNEPSEFFAF